MTGKIQSDTIFNKILAILFDGENYATFFVNFIFHLNELSQKFVITSL